MRMNGVPEKLFPGNTVDTALEFSQQLNRRSTAKSSLPFDLLHGDCDRALPNDCADVPVTITT
jgi:hypothetical protein